MPEPDLSVELAGLRLRNSVMLAAGILGLTAATLKRAYEAGAGAVSYTHLTLPTKRIV